MAEGFRIDQRVISGKVFKISISSLSLNRTRTGAQFDLTFRAALTRRCGTEIGPKRPTCQI